MEPSRHGAVPGGWWTRLAAVAVALGAMLVGAGGAKAQEPFLRAVSADGSRALFTTAEALTGEDTDMSVDIYERTLTGLRLISTGPAGGNGAAGVGFGGVAQDGARVYFSTTEPLTSDDFDVTADLYERRGATTTRVSTGPSEGIDPGNYKTFEGASADGERVFFATREQLTSDDTDAVEDIYERAFGDVTRRVSTGPLGGNENSGDPPTFEAASSDGVRVFFTTLEQLTAADNDAAIDIYERSGDTTTRRSVGPTGGNGAFDAVFGAASADGTRVYFSTDEKLTSDDPDTAGDVYQRSGGVTSRLSSGPLEHVPGSTALFAGASADGTRVFFWTEEALTSDDVDARADVYERSGSSTTLLTGGSADTHANPEGHSSDGTRVFFSTVEPVTADDRDIAADVFERSAGTTTRLSTGPIGGNDESHAAFAGASADGSRVFFEIGERLTVDDLDTQVDVYERSGGVTTRVSTGPASGNGAQDASMLVASSDGARVLFRTAERLTPADADDVVDVYERSGATTRLITGEGFPPVTTIDSGPAEGATVLSAAVTFGFTASEAGATFECRLDGAAFAACASPYAVELARGAHSFAVRATDPAGNQETAPVIRGFSIDVLDTEITAGPAALIAQTTAQFGFTSNDPGATFQCRLDDQLYAPCVSPFTTVALPDGTHGFEVRALDAAGNVDASPAVRAFTIDTLAPDTSITGGPGQATTTADPTPTFSFVSSEPDSSFQCRVDSGPFEACNTPATTPVLADGGHTFEVRAQDAVGHIEDTPALRFFFVDTPQVAPALPSTTAAGNLRVRVASTRLTMSRTGLITIKLTCSGSRLQRCKGTLSVLTRNRVKTTRGRRVVKLADVGFSLLTGKTGTIRLKLSRPNRSLVKRLRRVGVVARTTLSAPPAKPKPVSTRLTLSAPR